ncbi:MAG TPA: tetratricopeptide repeat protein [Candidatus Saccharimonadales bacterium]|nr:tetratricopeptide repeat protein [Candidatus Saccharimonadales bacterium]
MNISKAQKKIIKDNYKELSLTELAKKADLTEQTVSKYLKKFNKEPLRNSVSITSISERVSEITTNAKSINLKIIVLQNLDIFIGLALLCIAIYIETFFATFVSADDLNGFINNPITHNLAGAYKSLELHSIYYATVFSLFGNNALVMHIVSLTLHIVVSCLVFILFYLLFNRKVAAASAFLFAAHPVNVESVAWISGVGYLINGIFAFPFLIAYVMYKKSKNSAYLWISVAIYIVALVLVRLPWTLTAFAALLVIDQFLFEKKLNYKGLLKFWPFAVASALYGLSYLQTGIADRINNLSNNFGLKPEAAEPLLNRAPYTIYMMLRLYIFPWSLSIFHEGIGISLELYIFMIISTIAFIIWIIYAWKKQRVLAALSLCAFASILPTLSPVQVAFFIAERYMYFGTAFFSVILVILFIRLEEKTKTESLAVLLTIIVLFAYSIRSFIRVNDWKNSKNLWYATSLTEPGSARVFNNLGDAYSNENNYQNSINAFQRAIQIQPNYSDALHNLGNTYLQAGQLDLAEKYLLESYKINPSLYQATYKLGVVEYERGNIAKALEYFNLTLKLSPNNPDALKAIQIISAQKAPQKNP